MKCGCPVNDSYFAAMVAFNGNFIHVHADGSLGSAGPDGATSDNASKQARLLILSHHYRPRGWRA